MKIKNFLGTVMTLALFAAVNAQLPDKAKLDQLFDRIAEKNKGMGSVAIIKDGKPVYTRAFGYSQISDTDKKPMTAANRFRIGSVTKTFTAALILQLVDEKKLQLTQTIDKFLPQVPNANKITIEQILSHRSGIPNISRAQNAERNVNTLPMTKEEHLALIINTKPDFEPGTKSNYSNSGYFVLGLIIEKITGKSYESILHDKIIKKLGLKDTYLATGNIDVNKNEALTYFIVPGSKNWKQVPETHPSLLFSAGAIVSTPSDMAKFILALFDGKIISKESLSQMTKLRDGEGFGLVTFPYNGKTFYGHTGGADNYGAWMMYLPEEKLAITYTSNAKIYPVKDIISGVVDIYYNKPFEIPTFESVAVSSELLDKYVGVYATSEAPVKFTITRIGDTLYAQPPNSQNSAPLEATAQNKFKIDNGTATGIVFEFDIEKNQMTIKREGGERIFTKERK